MRIWQAGAVAGAFVVVAVLGFSCKPRNTGSSTSASEATSADGGDLKVGFRKVPAFLDAGIAFTQPTFLFQMPGDSRNWFVLEKPGKIKRFPNRPDVRPDEIEVVADLEERVASGGPENVTFEEGLYQLEFHPDFPANDSVYVSYTGFDPNKGRPSQDNLFTRVSRFRFNSNNLTIDPKSEQILLQAKKDRGNHNGGALAFEMKNGKKTSNLLIGFGDGGIVNDGNRRGGDPKNLLAKVHRIDVDGREVRGLYSIPNDNPFKNDNRFAPEIFTWGHRNPWRISIDPNDGTIYEAEVGQNAFEEVNVLVAGENYGWPFLEALKPNAEHGDTKAKVQAILGNKKPREPVAFYGRQEGLSVTGGYVYRGKNEKLAVFRGKYIMGDFANGALWALFPNENKTKFKRVLVGNLGIPLASFGEDNDGELYAIDHKKGKIFKLVEGPAVQQLDPEKQPLHLWLSRDGIGTPESADEYYQSICAAESEKFADQCRGQEPTPTFTDWTRVNKFEDGTVVKTLYKNDGDLGFWRDMNCTPKIVPGEGGCYVSNWRDENAKAKFEALSPEGQAKAVQNKEAIVDLGTVTMNISPEGFTRFYVFFPNVVDGKFVRKLQNFAVLDSEGVKHVPQLCTPCHAGQYNGSDNPDMGALFREFDPFVLKKHPAKSEDQAEREWFAVNKIARQANKVLIEKKKEKGAQAESDDDLAAYQRQLAFQDAMYDLREDGSGEVEGTPFRKATLAEDMPPPTWKEFKGSNQVYRKAKAAMWRDFVGPYCMQCHRINTVDFAFYETFAEMGNVSGFGSDLEAHMGFFDPNNEQAAENILRFENGQIIGQLSKGVNGEIQQDTGNTPLKVVNEARTRIKFSEERGGKDFMPNAIRTRNQLMRDKKALKAMREWLVQVGSDDQVMVRVEFKIKADNNLTHAGNAEEHQDMYVIGSLKQLGAQTEETKNGAARPKVEKWDVVSGLKLKGAFSPNDNTVVWTGAVNLPLGSTFRFKSYVFSTIAERVKWQVGNRGELQATIKQSGNLSVVENCGIADYLVKVQPTGSNNDDPSKYFQTIEVGFPGSARPRYENDFHPDREAGACPP